MLIYFSRLKVAETGILCRIPFFQSRCNDEVSSSFSLIELMLFEIVPEYDIEIFSYQRSLPTITFRLNG